MKLLLDENLSRHLVRGIEDLFPGSSHVSLEGLLQASDVVHWDYARANGFAIVSADADFYELAIPWVRHRKLSGSEAATIPTAVAEKLIRNEAIRIAEFDKDPIQAVLILRPR